jgi:PAS domain S-box-containing protein
MSSTLAPQVPVGEHNPPLDHSLVTTFLKHVPDAVYFKDRESRFIAMSASFVKLFGKQSEAEILGKSDFDFFDKAHAQPAYDDEQAIIRTGEPMLGKLEKESWPDGHVTWVQTSKLPLRDLTGAIIGTFGISRDVTRSKNLEATLETKHKELMDTSRVAGKAEVATGVLHNVGNVLNSLNVSASVIASGFRQSKTDSLAKLCQLLREHTADLGPFLTVDPKGRRVPEFIESLARHFSSERDRLLQELASLQKNVDHIKEIVSMQQTYALMVGTVETLDAPTLMEDALRMNSSALTRHEVQVVREFEPVPPVIAEKSKVLQILVNLIRNSKYACDEGGRPTKIMTLRVTPGEPGYVRLIVQDNGIGILPENLPNIFQHGFTTKATGHGFGVHSSALAAKEMKGVLTVYSEGLGLGAAFTLELPAARTSVRP